MYYVEPPAISSIIDVMKTTVWGESRFPASFLEVILGLWQSEDGHFGYEGKYYQVHAPESSPELERRLYYKPYQKPTLPSG